MLFATLSVGHGSNDKEGENMMTQSEQENHLLKAYREMDPEERQLMDQASTLIMRERIVSDQTVAAMSTAIAGAYKRSAAITMQGMAIIQAGETVEGMDRDRARHRGQG